MNTTRIRVKTVDTCSNSIAANHVLYSVMSPSVSTNNFSKKAKNEWFTVYTVYTKCSLETDMHAAFAIRYNTCLPSKKAQ